MKKLILVVVVTLVGFYAEAQINLPKLPVTKDAAASMVKNFIAPPPIGDITKTTDDVTGKLMSSLKLGADKKQSLTTPITSFLTQKKDIIGLAKTDPTQYLAKFNPLQKGLFAKLKTSMGAAAFSKFLGMKPKGGDASNVLSNLFF